MVVEFGKINPDGFFDWVEENPDGFFVNTFQILSERYIKIHSAKCGIATSSKHYGPAGATKNDYKKICGKSPSELFEELAQKNIQLKAKNLCRKCSARELQIPQANTSNEVVLTTDEPLDKEGRKKLFIHFAAERSRRNRDKVLKSRLQPYSCDACSISLDFYGAEYGGLIHVHHTQPVGQGEREPKKEDFLLLCPNCHAVAHWGNATKPLKLEELKKKAAMMRAKWATQT